MLKPSFVMFSLLLASASGATAQLISIRTVPVSQSHQFEIFPSRTVGMGGVGIAIADSLLDPFVNPAFAVRSGDTRFFGTPSTYSVSQGAGGGRTLPLGAIGRLHSWYAGAFVAVQEVDMSERLLTVPPPCLACLRSTATAIEMPAPDRSHGNTYAHALLGRDLGNGLSLGGSVDWARLRAVDGVDLLYAGSAGLEQYGHAVDVRIGMLKQLSGDRSLEALVLHNRFGTTHDVYYLDPMWDPGTGTFTQQPRLEKNLDRTRTWGMHLAYEQPISRDGWRGGAIFTANRMDHPKIPNYEIMNIPRDPGNSSAFNVGLGLSRQVEKSTFALDVVYEPIWSHTWADAAQPIATTDGRVIAPGGMTIENRFRFANAHARMGVAQDFTINNDGLLGELQLGLAVRRFQYHLAQSDHVQLTKRSLDEHWTEWQPTWGLSLRFPALEVRYHGSVTNGTGRPGVGGGGVFAVDEAASLGTNILAAPSGPLTLNEVKVTTHQVSISLPIH
jgi:hypothetical protein